MGLIIGGFVGVAVAIMYLIKISRYKSIGADSVGFLIVTTAFGAITGRLAETTAKNEHLPGIFVQVVLLAIWVIHIIIFIRSAEKKRDNG